MTLKQFAKKVEDYFVAEYPRAQAEEITSWLKAEPEHLLDDLWLETRELELYNGKTLPIISDFKKALDKAKERYANRRPEIQANQSAITDDAGDPILPPEEIAQRLASLPFRVPIGDLELRRAGESV